MKHERFHYRSLDDVRAELDKLSVRLPLSDNVSVLASPVTFGGHTLHNRLGIAPMEGADSLPDGSPSELTRQRYIRLAESGVAMIWTEAVAITPEGRSSPRQLLLNEQNLPEYARMISDIKAAGIKKNGFAPYIVMQANHSGRYSKPDGTPKPIIAYRHPIYEQTRPADDSCIASDDYLLRLCLLGQLHRSGRGRGERLLRRQDRKAGHHRKSLTDTGRKGYHVRNQMHAQLLGLQQTRLPLGERGSVSPVLPDDQC